MEASRRVMTDLLRRSGIEISEEQSLLFWRYYQLLMRYNEECDLTRLKRFEDIVVKHFADCLHVAGMTELPSPLLDIGSGAGFPGIPLKIVRPDCRMILAEPRSRRVEFLRRVIDELGLGEIEVYPHKVTEISRFEVNGVITRALESVSGTLARVHHFLPEGGLVIFMKGPRADDDIEALEEEAQRDYKLEADRAYILPATGYERRLLVYRKTSNAQTITYRILIDPRENALPVITSPENRQYKDWKKLLTPDGIRRQNRALVAGARLVEESADEDKSGEALLLFDGYREGGTVMNGLIARYAREGRCFLLKKNLFNELDLFGTGRPLLVRTLPEMGEWNGEEPSGCVLMLPFQDPSNVGAAVRSALAFGVREVILLREAAHPFHPRSVRASGGAVLKVRFLRGPALAALPDLARDRGLGIITLDREGAPLRGYPCPENFFLIPGVEGPGLPDELKGTALSIPIGKEVESLNASVALSIALYEWSSGNNQDRTVIRRGLE